MTSLRKLEHDFVLADLAAVTGLLAQLGDEDVMTRFGLESRREELQNVISELERQPDEPTASAALFFGGQPVVAARGIESEFAGEAVSKFQDIVAKVFADEAGALGQRGVVPNKSASVLHITNIVRGSFGFLLEEVHPQRHFVGSSLKDTVDKVTRLLEAFADPDEEHFRSAVETVDQRVLTTARDFFGLMRQREATLRLVTGDRDRSFGPEAVLRAVERATSTVVEEDKEDVRGQLSGTLPDGHLFEFRAEGGRGTLRGRVARDLTPDQLTRFNRELVNIDAVASLHVRRVRRSDVVVRENFVLTALTPLSDGRINPRT